MDLAKYYEQINKEPLLTKEEEKDLFLELDDIGLSQKRRDAIRDRIIRANLRFVFKEAKKFSKNDPMIFEDLIAAGNEGLIVGMDKFKPESGNRFLTYAGFWVIQRILKHMSNLRIVSLPIWRQQLSARIQKQLDANENITFEELRKQFPEVPKKDLLELFQTRFLTYYIEDLGEDSAFEINPIEDQVNAKLDQAKLHAGVRNLPEPHRSVITMLFGLDDGEERKHSEISAELKLSKDALKTIKREALVLLKDELGGVNPFV
jgi:RNA polymerase nonessential primary-like sigma factor